MRIFSLIFSVLFVGLEFVTISCKPRNNSADISQDSSSKKNSVSDFPQETSPTNTIPLFQSDDVLDFELLSDFPFRAYRGQKKDFRKFPGTLRYRAGERWIETKVDLEARGSGRLSHCDFAPFKIYFQGDLKGTLFEKAHDTLKVVTHCYEGKEGKAEADGEEAIMVELLLYQTLEAFGVYSFRTRPVKVAYKKMNGKDDVTKLAFFIEHKRNLVQRYSRLKKPVPDDYSQKIMEKAQKDGVPENKLHAHVSSMLNIDSFITTYFAQMMILNDDWSGTITGSNLETFIDADGKIARSHYDLDMSRFVAKFGQTISKGSLTFEGTAQQKYNLPPSQANDETAILSLCGSSEFPFTAEEKKSACKRLIPLIAKRRANVLDVIKNSKLVSDKKKQEIVSRFNFFFDAFEKVKLD